MADFDDTSSDPLLPPGRHEHGAARHTGSTPTYPDETLTSGTRETSAPQQQGTPQLHESAQRHGSGRRRRLLWIALPVAIVVAAVVLLTPTISNWISVSVDDEDRQIDLGGDAPIQVTVPAGWVLEQRPFASETVMHSPDGVVAMCFSTTEDEVASLSDRLTEEQGWTDATFSVEQAPSGASIYHAIRLPSADNITDESTGDSSGTSDTDDAAETDIDEHPCGNHPVSMLAVVDPGSDAENAGELVAVRVGAEGDISPYLGEIADILAGVTLA
ncbi:hypothetical protein [Gulosibacter chungangensis]|uniref:Uncharacterized protein n=1 Tax=Gulosibacter chungangensis TaxID=979746 RepID=A0A7J5B7V8_9MICO|nr:hypothetical protein [Gulosibacter chungangensis]KAB1641214.1 hypothetical protein F8O05_13385 [Gulosibacter chungangensis]